MKLLKTYKEKKMSKPEDYKSALASIENSLDSFPEPIRNSLKHTWETRGCLGLVRACQAARRAFPVGEDAELLGAISAHALHLEAMISEDVGTLEGGAA